MMLSQVSHLDDIMTHSAHNQTLPSPHGQILSMVLCYNEVSSYTHPVQS